jgi:hypothetical protein
MPTEQPNWQKEKVPAGAFSFCKSLQKIYQSLS